MIILSFLGSWTCLPTLQPLWQRQKVSDEMWVEVCSHAGDLSPGEEIPSPEETDQKVPGDRPESPVSTHYHLRGIVVHSGQASGGHYYSFIRVRWGHG